METVDISAQYDAYFSCTIELPEGYTAKDIKKVSVKWAKVLFIYFKDGAVAYSSEVNPDNYHWDNEPTKFIPLDDSGYMDESSEFKWPAEVRVWSDDFDKEVVVES